MEAAVIADLKKSHGITFNRITPVTGGWLNLKWKLSTEKGELLVKQYSAKRFRREQIERIESALQRQLILGKYGVPCPALWQCADCVIRWPDNETAYMVMDFCSGKTESSDTITIAQMHSLGSACGFMHKAFSQLPAPATTSLPASGGYTMDALWDNFNSRRINCPPDANSAYQEALLAMEPILKQLSAKFFDRLPKGFSHEDFHSGNILFHADGVSAVVDFDRNCYSYIWHDIGRAILSFALKGNVMNSDMVRAFLEGYSRHSTLTLPNISDALRLSWCVETPWWIQPDFFRECNGEPRRFRDEMLWLTEHWFELDSILGS